MEKKVKSIGHTENVISEDYLYEKCIPFEENNSIKKSKEGNILGLNSEDKNIKKIVDEKIQLSSKNIFQKEQNFNEKDPENSFNFENKIFQDIDRKNEKKLELSHFIFGNSKNLEGMETCDQNNSVLQKKSRFIKLDDFSDYSCQISHYRHKKINEMSKYDYIIKKGISKGSNMNDLQIQNYFDLEKQKTYFENIRQSIEINNFYYQDEDQTEVLDIENSKNELITNIDKKKNIFQNGAFGKTVKLISPQQYHALKKMTLYKTEICRSFEENGFCRYGPKCQFAHSLSELRLVERHPRYKTEICKTYWDDGTCPYGKRCCFIHRREEIKSEEIKSVEEQEEIETIDIQVSEPIVQNIQKKNDFFPDLIFKESKSIFESKLFRVNLTPKLRGNKNIVGVNYSPDYDENVSDIVSDLLSGRM